MYGGAKKSIGYLNKIWNQGSFSPLDIPGIKLWLQSDLGITLVSSKVNVWADVLTTSGLAFTAPAAGNRPTVVAAGLNGIQTIAFARLSEQFLRKTGSAIYTYTGNGTVFIVAKANITGVTQYPAFFSQGTSPGTVTTEMGIGPATFPLNANEPSLDSYGSKIYDNNTHTNNTWYIYVFQWSNWSSYITNAATIMLLNGAALTISAYAGSTDPTALNTTQMEIGNYLDTGTAPKFNGEMFSQIHYDTVLTSIQINQVLNYLRKQTAIY